MRETKAHIGIATDGDADRFGIVDEDGTFFQPNYIIALLFDYLVESRGWKNGVAKSVATTNLINALAKHHGIELHETPVGFKYIGELIKQDKIAIGGEESAGLSIRHHVPEKDGVLAGLLCCEMVARRGKSLGQQLQELFAKVGSFYSLRENFRLTPEVKEKFTGKLQREPREFMGRKVTEVVRTDGLKLVFADGSWVCYRLSGTEPVVRVYSEARSTRRPGETERSGQSNGSSNRAAAKNPGCTAGPARAERAGGPRSPGRGVRLSAVRREAASRFHLALRFPASPGHRGSGCDHRLAVSPRDVWRQRHGGVPAKARRVPKPAGRKSTSCRRKTTITPARSGPCRPIPKPSRKRRASSCTTPARAKSFT